ncbi:MAG: alpha-mannosidase, partial [Oscillospiraceae bacterium]
MQKKIHVISNTHWDREHRHSFEVTRLMLVDLMDSLINIMENDPKYKFFTLDGQSIIIDDYLEVKPHMETRLKKLIHDGRILIGPWYSLADCFSVKPESIVRNLLYGNKTCKKYGEPMKVGYSIFSFGQIAQLPQIYNGFDISDIVFYKGATEKEIPKSEFLWKAPDGTTALTTRLGKEKRWN